MLYDTHIHKEETLLDKISYFFSSLIRVDSTSKELSRMINCILDNPNTKIAILDQFTALVGPLSLWIENYPYAYGKLWINWELYKKDKKLYDYNKLIYQTFGNQIPDRATVYRLHKLVKPLLEEYRMKQLDAACKLM